MGSVPGERKTSTFFVGTLVVQVIKSGESSMKMKSRFAFGLALLLSLLVAIPTEVWAAPQSGVQRAGEVSRVIPAVNIARSGKTITASAKTSVDWLDLVSTQVNARARIALDDGSVLSVGSESSMKVVKHDAGAQQTELELTYGKLRTQAQRIAKPDGKFEVRTPAGVAGGGGTDFFLGYMKKTMQGIAFLGLEIGRAAWRGRVEISGGGGSFKKKKKKLLARSGLLEREVQLAEENQNIIKCVAAELVVGILVPCTWSMLYHSAMDIPLASSVCT